jgi:UDP-galactopyranose mutase
VSAELCDAYGHGVPLEGLCLLPVIDRQDWNDPNHWHNSGLWDIVRLPDGTLSRVLNEEYGQEVTRSQALLARCGWGDRVEP